MRINGSRIHCEVEVFAGQRNASSGNAGLCSDVVRESFRVVATDELGPFGFLLGLCRETIVPLSDQVGLTAK